MINPTLICKKSRMRFWKQACGGLKRRKGEIMKKIFALGIVVLAISLGLSACGEKGGTVKLKNDTTTRYAFTIRFDGVTQRVKDGITALDPGQSCQAVSDTDTTFVVYSGTTLLKSGDLSGGKTVEIKFSDYE
jgi:hypothetical protein